MSLTHDRECQKCTEQQRLKQLEKKRNDMQKKDEALRESREALLEDITQHGGFSVCRVKAKRSSSLQ